MTGYSASVQVGARRVIMSLSIDPRTVVLREANWCQTLEDFYIHKALSEVKRRKHPESGSNQPINRRASQ